MELYCDNCGYVVDAGEGEPLYADKGTIEYTYECPDCGHRGAEYSWIENGQRIYSAPEMKPFNKNISGDIPF